MLNNFSIRIVRITSLIDVLLNVISSSEIVSCHYARISDCRPQN